MKNLNVFSGENKKKQKKKLDSNSRLQGIL